VLLHRHRVVGAALDGRVVGDDDALATGDAADAGDDAGAGSLVAVHAGGGQRRQLEERAARVEQGVDAVAREQLAPRHVALARRRRAAQRGGLEPAPELVHEGALRRVVAGEVVAAGVRRAAQDRDLGGGVVSSP
jgi:hypothetical protein